MQRGGVGVLISDIRRRREERREEEGRAGVGWRPRCSIQNENPTQEGWENRIRRNAGPGGA